MKGFAWRALLLALLLIPLADGVRAQSPAVEPAQYKSAGSFSGGSYAAPLIVSSIRFGTPEPGATRMVLDLHSVDMATGARASAAAHPVYSVELHSFPYRLVIRMEQTYFDPALQVGASPALPFSVVTAENTLLREMQVFLPGPCEFKVIEIDDPAKLSIDVRPLAGAAVPDVWTVQLTSAGTPEQAFALVEAGGFPESYRPSVLVLGRTVVVEQAFTDMVEAARVDASLREMGYSTVINERSGNELPHP